MSEPLTAIGTTAAAIAAFFAVFVAHRQSGIAERQLFVTILDHMHQRYANLHHELTSLSSNYGELSNEHQRAIDAYINLCSEEFRWHKLGFVGEDVWRVWDAGIAQKLKLSAIRQAWEQVHSNEAYYDGFKDYINATLQTSA